ncbi:MAG: O-antigen ligase family protein, partial [Rhodobiaceae bacterium]|nr:O-antigen ligase family protein [Rhodobiaceae bacterium]
MTASIDRLLALWIGLVFPLAIVPSPRIAQFFIGAAIALILAGALVDAWRTGGLAETARQVRSALLEFASPRWRPAHILLVFCLYALATTLWSFKPAFSAERAGRFLLVAVLSVAFVGLAAPRLSRLKPELMVAGTALSALLCFADWATGAHLLTGTDRPASFIEYNRTAQQCAALVFFAVWCAPRWRLAMTAAFLVVGGFVAYSDNETAKLAFIGTIVGLIVLRFVPARAALTLSMFAFAAAVILLPVLQPALLDLVAGSPLEALLKPSHQRRLFIWDHIGMLFYQHPVFGAGFDVTRFGPEIGTITFFNGTSEHYPTPFHPHGQILQVAYETGIA